MKTKLLLLSVTFFYLGSLFSQSRSTENVGFDEISVIEFAKNGDIWIGSNGQGVSFYRAQDQSLRYFNNDTTKLKSDSINAITLLPVSNKLYSFIGTENGVSVTTSTTSNWSFLSNVANNSIKGLFVDSPSLWVLTATNGAYLYNVDTTAPNFIASPPSSHYQFSCVQHGSTGCDSAGFTAGTVNGGVVYTKDGAGFDTINMQPPHQKLIDNRVNVVVWDDSCRARIVGTKSGFSVCPVRQGHIGTPADTCHNFMAGYDVTSIVSGCDGKIWIGTTVGLFTIDLSALPPTPVQVSGIQQNQTVSTLSKDTGCNMLVALQGDSNLYFLNPNGGYVDTLKISDINKVNTESFSVKIYPQPSSNLINFVSEQIIKNGEFSLFDITGRMQQQISLGITSHFTTDVSSLQNGIYFYRIISDKQIVKTGKLQVLK